MKIDTNIVVNNLREVATLAQAAEAMGFDGLWSSETSHDPFLMSALVAEQSGHGAPGPGSSRPQLWQIGPSSAVLSSTLIVLMPPQVWPNQACPRSNIATPATAGRPQGHCRSRILGGKAAVGPSGPSPVAFDAVTR